MAIRDPSDGSVRDPSLLGTLSENKSRVLETDTSGLPITKAKDLARLEESKKWLENYVRPTING